MTDDDKTTLLELAKIVEWTANNPEKKDDTTLAYTLQCVAHDLETIAERLYASEALSLGPGEVLRVYRQ